jgi:phosphatidylserine/phosphatidylglycerophosphate/cardiolipin synthase-like enzyme
MGEEVFTSTRRGGSNKKAIVAVFIVMLIFMVILSFLSYRQGVLDATGGKGIAQPTPVSTSSPSGYALEYFYCFSPDGNCRYALIDELEAANQSIRIAIYSFTEESITNTLVAAYHKGVDVKVVMDKQQAGSDYSQYENLQRAGVPVRLDTVSGYMHNKYVVIDEKVIITGSYNWSNNAENNNYENLLILHDDNIAWGYKQDFDAIWMESE